MLDANTFGFLNETHTISTTSDWNNPTLAKLWLYNLHYFDDLNARDSQTRYNQHEVLIKRWINENPACSGNGWEPYPLSLRIVNWVKWLSKQERKNETADASLQQQTEALGQQLEYHILGNHLFANAKALVFAGAYLKTPQTERFLDKGLKILEQQTKEQFLSDGGHFELSPMYHCILLNDLLELIELSYISGNAKLNAHLDQWTAVASKALTYLEGMTHPDGDISFFNDAAFGIAPPVEHIFSFAKRLGITHQPIEQGITTFEQSGYSRLQKDDRIILLDHGNVGPDYLPGHAHADTLSFEYSYKQQRIIVNSGTSMYGAGKERLRQRQTPAHSTVEFNQQSSSEVWDGFRVAKRAYGRLINASSSNESFSLKASHNGYKQLGNQNERGEHQRTLTLDEHALIIEDIFKRSSKKVDKKTCEGTIYFHFHPEVKIEKLNPHLVKLVIDSDTRVSNQKSMLIKTEDMIKVKEGTWHPYFGMSIPNKSIAVKMSKNSHITVIEFESEN